MVQDMLDDPQNSYGFRLKMETESQYRRLNFASRNHASSSLRPKLVVTYHETAGVAPNLPASNIQLYPNPAFNMLNISSSEEIISIAVFNYTGAIIEKIDLFSTETTIDVADYESGIYFVQFTSANGINSTRKLEVLH